MALHDYIELYDYQNKLVNRGSVSSVYLLRWNSSKSIKKVYKCKKKDASEL